MADRIISGLNYLLLFFSSLQVGMVEREGELLKWLEVKKYKIFLRTFLGFTHKVVYEDTYEHQGKSKHY